MKTRLTAVDIREAIGAVHVNGALPQTPLQKVESRLANQSTQIVAVDCPLALADVKAIMQIPTIQRMSYL